MTIMMANIDKGTHPKVILSSQSQCLLQQYVFIQDDSYKLFFYFPFNGILSPNKPEHLKGKCIVSFKYFCTETLTLTPTHLNFTKKRAGAALPW